MRQARARRWRYVLATVVALIVGYVIFVLTAPVLGLWLVWEGWQRRDPRNVIFANFSRG